MDWTTHTRAWMAIFAIGILGLLWLREQYARKVWALDVMSPPQPPAYTETAAGEFGELP